jgi:hypothetical protein
MMVVAKPLKLAPSSSSNDVKPKESEKRKTPHVQASSLTHEATTTLSYQHSIINNNPNTYKVRNSKN